MNNTRFIEACRRVDRAYRKQTEAQDAFTHLWRLGGWKPGGGRLGRRCSYWQRQFHRWYDKYRTASDRLTELRKIKS